MGDHAIGHAGETQRAGVLHAGHTDFSGGDSQFLQGCDGATNGFLNLGVKVIVVIVGRYAHGQAADAALQQQRIVVHRDRNGAGIQGVVSGDGLQHQGAVAHGTGHRANVVAVEAGDQQAALADPSEGLLQPDHAAEGPGQAHRPAQVGSQGREGDAGGHVGATASAGTPGDVVYVPGVVHRAVVRVVGSCARGELLQVFLADDDGAGGLAAAHDLSIFIGHMVPQYLGAEGSGNASRGDVVFDADGYTVERTPVLAAGQGVLSLFGLCQRLLAHDGDEGVQRGLASLRFVKGGLGELYGRNFPCLDQRGDFRDGQLEQFGIRHRFLLHRLVEAGART